MVNVSNAVTNVVLVIVAIILVFNIVGGTAGDLTGAADNISGSGLPLASLFQSDGVVLLIFMAGVLLAIVGLAFAIKMKK